MKELIDKLSIGIIDCEIPEASVDLEKIEMSFMPDEMYEGNFQIINTGRGKLKGIIYSSNRHIRVKTRTFGGSKSVIRYVIDTHYLREGSQIRGNICIVSNGGELHIPFFIKINTKNIHTSLGELKNMFHFADLAQKDYEQALRIFTSPRFAEVFLREDYALRAKYEALSPGTDKNIALDEFLIAANKKKAVNLRVAQQEMNYENLKEDYEDRLILKKDNWGYVKAEITSKGEFIQIEKTLLTKEDFTGNICEIPYIIKAGLLHEGYNHGVIYIKSLRDELKIPIKVCKYTKDPSVSKSSYLEYKKDFAELYQCYLDFRMRFIPLQIWVDNSFHIITKMRKIKDEDLFLQLAQAQIMSIQKKEVEAKLLLDDAAKRLEGMNTNVEWRCFYLYVRAVREKNEEYTKEALKEIKDCYENGHESWKLLWLIMYLDENYDKNESLKMIRIKEQYNNGMRSPLMYCETLLVLNETPSLLRVLDDFEKSVILFGVERQYLSERLTARILDLCGTQKGFDKQVFEILAGMYAVSETAVLLSEIVGILIKNGKSKKKYFFWYERAVELGLKITGLYEYYMYSIPFDFQGRIPDVILMYFVYNLTLNGERLDFLYQKVIEYKKEAPNIYQLYARTIEKYAGLCIQEGRINDKLAIVYKDVLKRIVPAPETSQKLPDIINTYMIICDNPNILEAVIIHKEQKKEQHVPFIKNKAYARIYSEDAAVVFADKNGNRYMQTVNYQMKKLMSQEEILKICYEIHPDNLGLLIYFNDKYFRYRKYQDKAVTVMEKLVMTHDIREEYRLYLEEEILRYYSSGREEGDFVKYLENLRADELSASLRIQVIETAVISGLYERGFRLMSQYGSDEIDPRLILKCVDKIIDRTDEEENEDFIYFSFDAFRKGKYNENTLRYIGKYYYGSTQEMYNVWQAVKNFQCESRELEEKLIVQMLFTREYGRNIGSIFESYLANGASYKVKWAYLIQKSYDYFVKQAIIDEGLFRHIEDELDGREEVHSLCRLAWLKYQSERELNEREARLCKTILYEMCKRNKRFEFYKKFTKYFRLPPSVENKTILEYRTEPDCEVYVHYLPEDEDEGYKTEKMTNACHGIFTHEFLLFYGETLKYYITEKKQETINATESRELSLVREHSWRDDSPYGILNNILICCEMQEEQTLKELAVDYYVQKKLNETIFTIV